MVTPINFSEFERLLSADAYVLHILKVLQSCLPDAYVAAGFIRNRVWDAFYGQMGSYPDLDIDVIHFDQDNKAPEDDYILEEKLNGFIEAPWQVRNQARMHEFGGHKPFCSVEDALMRWAETATTVGVRLTEKGQFEFIAPFGFDDLLAHILRITPSMQRHNPEGFYQRIAAKNWLSRWPKLQIIAD